MERFGKSRIRSAASGEGPVNIYWDTGKVLPSPFWAARFNFIS